MQLKEIYQNGHTMLSKDGNEGLISIPNFNTLCESIIYELIREESVKNSVILQNGNEELLSLRILQDLIVSTSIFITLGSTPLISDNISYDMLYWIVMNTSTAYNGAIRKIKLVTNEEYMSRYTNLMNMNIDENPIAYIINEEVLELGVTYYRDYAYINPSDITAAQFTFVRVPATPFLDYYMDANYKTQFMDAGASHLLTAGEQYRDGTTTGTKTSLTQELQIPEDYHPKFQDKVIERLSLPLDDQYKNQYAMTKENKS